MGPVLDDSFKGVASSEKEFSVDIHIFSTYLIYVALPYVLIGEWSRTLDAVASP